MDDFNRAIEIGYKAGEVEDLDEDSPFRASGSGMGGNGILSSSFFDLLWGTCGIKVFYYECILTSCNKKDYCGKDCSHIRDSISHYLISLYYRFVFETSHNMSFSCWIMTEIALDVKGSIAIETAKNIYDFLPTPCCFH
jgi:hypothetical protein